MRRTTWLHRVFAILAALLALNVSADDGHANVPKAREAIAVADSYGFAQPTKALYDLSASATQLIGPDVDNGPALADIGFDFFFQGAAYQQFSLNSNGLLKLGSGFIQPNRRELACAQRYRFLATAA